jgi:LuxR family transcriptional regulator, maltose regulon positive regulatory protein
MNNAALPLVQTKLTLPPPRSHILPRERLMACGPEPGVRLVLVEAPAGFGKTTLLASWCQALRTKSDTAVAWLSLEASENDPARFLAYLTTAITSLLLSAPHPLPLISDTDDTLTVLLNALTDQQRAFVLVLDDYHLITAPAAHTAVAFLLDHLPPHGCLAITSRAEPPLPLARLRARAELVELRAADLRFTEAEGSAFLHTSLGYALPDAVVHALYTYTEGWPAGLQLLALALKAQGYTTDPDLVQEGLKSIKGSERLVFAYLADEVFAQQPAEVQRFLLHTAVLDHLNGALCAAVLKEVGSDDGMDMAGISATTQQLTALEQANIFLEPLDHERTWFRFHPLFHSFLRDRLAHEATLCPEELHRRAAMWHQEHEQSTQAIHHLLAAGDTDAAAVLMDALAAPLVARGEYATLHAWLDDIPSAVIEVRPQLCLWAAWSALFSGEVERIAPLLSNAETRWLEAHDDAHLGEVMHLRAHLARLQRDPAQTIHYAQQALAQLPPEQNTLRAGSLLALGAGQLLAGDLDAAHTTLSAALVACQHHNALGALVAQACLGDLAAERGDLVAAQRYYQGAITDVGQRMLWERWRAAVRLADIMREHDQLDAAATMLEAALQGAEREGVAVYLSEGYLSLARTRWAQGDGETALRALEQGLRQAQRLGSEAATRELRAWQVRLALVRHDETFVQAWLAEVAPRRGDGGAALDTHEVFTLVRVLLAPGQYAHQSEVRSLLAPLQHRAEVQGCVVRNVEVWLLWALADVRDGHHAHAVATLRRALALAMPGCYVRLFVDEGAPAATLLTETIAHYPPTDPLRIYGTQLLTACAAYLAHGTQQERALGESEEPHGYWEPLSERELEVLRLVAIGASNKTIAESIVVSVGTVKSHLNHILGKLAARNRTEAVARARMLGLLA